VNVPELGDQTGGVRPRNAPDNTLINKSTTKARRRSFAISAANPAKAKKPKNAAINARTKNVKAQPSMFISSGVLDRYTHALSESSLGCGMYPTGNDWHSNVGWEAWRHLLKIASGGGKPQWKSAGLGIRMWFPLHRLG
jgi:hypothetical protein